MKSIPIALAPEYAGAGSTLCVCLKVTRSDAVVVGFTSLDVPLTVDGVVYEPGFEPGEIVEESTLAVGNLELKVLPDSPAGLSVERADLIAGLWDRAAFEIFECNWKAPADGRNVIKRGTMGEAQANRGSFAIELRGLKQALQQPVGAVTSKTCRYRLGDDLCTIDLAGFTNDYPTTAVASRRQFTFGAAVEVDDFYGEGIARALDGANEGYSRKVKTFAAGVVTLATEMPFTVAIGDTFSLVAGCRKRAQEDCKTKYGNLVNFGGEPDVPGTDAITADPEPV